MPTKVTGKIASAIKTLDSHTDWDPDDDGDPMYFTHAYMQWVTEHDGPMVGERTTERITALLRTVPRNREGSISASAIGTCERAQYHRLVGTPESLLSAVPDPYTQALFMDGHWRHLRLQAIGLDSGALTHVEVAGRKGPKFRGTIDGVNDRLKLGFEFKGMNPYGFSGLSEPMAQHVLQVHAYMWLSGYQRFHIVYECKATHALKEYVVFRDEAVIDNVKRIVARIANADVPPPVCDACVKRLDIKCPWAHRCQDELP